MTTMSNDRNAFKAGLFIVISIALIVAIVVAIRGAEQIFQPNQTLTARFDLKDDLSGLRVGDEVRVGGLKMGVIRAIRVAGHDTEAADDDHLVVTFTLPERIPLRGKPSLRVQSTITGTAWLNIDNLGTGNVLTQADVIDGLPGTFTILMDAASELGPELTGTVRDVRQTTIPKVNDTIATYKTTGETATRLVEHVDSKVDPIADKVATVSDRTSEVMVEARDLMGDTKGDFRTTMANVSTATGSLKDKLPAILDRADGVLAKVQTAVDATNESLADVKDTAGNAKEISASVRGVIVGNRGRIDNMIASLKTTGDNLKFASAEIRRSPWRLLYKPGKGEMANLNLYDSARQFAEGAGNLNDAATALRDALKDPDAQPAHVQKLVEQLDQTFAGFKQVEDELWSRVRD
jgi:ABC-type transporter Mla subunit MlaD